MSPRGSSSSTSTQSPRNAGGPYSRRSTSQPKSSRQQFSACGACRMRRVRCDLKDLPPGSVAPHPACSNCKERGIKCVDEFADVKAVKLLRRGRRLQQVEAIYGKTADADGNSSSSSLPSGTRLSSIIPTLQPEFFTSPFWQWFLIQRPILDASEFPARFAAHCKGSQSLGSEGRLIAMLLVVWAASFGLDERGIPVVEDFSGDTPGTPDSPYPGTKRRHWKSKTETMLREIMELIDFHGVLRRPTLDGVRVLLLLLPLMEEAQPLERLAIYEATLSQVQAVCVLSACPSSGFEDAAVRARIFWYAYTQEGIATGIRGGRFVLTSEDLETFQRTLPPPNSSPPSLDSTNMGGYQPSESGRFTARDIPSHKAYVHLITTASTPLDLSNVCRKIHSVLTGIKATRRAENLGLIDAQGMRDIWRDLDRCWQEFENIKRAPIDNGVRRLEIDQYASGWQIFIFECHNVIREALKPFLANSTSQSMYTASSPSRPGSSHSINSSPYLSPHHLHATATRKCLSLLPRVIRILRPYVSNDHGNLPGIFQWDAGLVRDGCFFAGYLAASIDGDSLSAGEDDFKQESVDGISSLLTVDDGLSICLAALATMRWGFSKSEEREDTIAMIWENRKMRRQGHSPQFDADYPQSITVPDSSTHLSLSRNSQKSANEDRPMLPSLNLFISQRRVDSAPSTSCSTDSRGMNGWPSYTPPGTDTSIATSTGTGFSGRGSPVFAHLATFKGPSDDLLYHGNSDLDHFNYNAPLPGPVIRESSGLTTSAASFPHRHSPISTHTLTASTATNYISSNTFNANTSLLPHADFHDCPQFGENCNGTYH